MSVFCNYRNFKTIIRNIPNFSEIYCINNFLIVYLVNSLFLTLKIKDTYFNMNHVAKLTE